MPKVSVITVVKDDPSGLRATYESLIGQTFNDWEMLIVALPLPDETFAIATKLQSSDSRIHLHKQVSTGIYGAMNEGISGANGEFIWFMNAGDTFASNTVLTHAVEECSNNPVGVLIGGYKILDAAANQIFSYPEAKVTAIGFAFNRRGGCHQAMIFRTQVLKDIGGFNTAYALASDFDLVLKVIKKADARRVSEKYAAIEPGGRADQGIFLVHKEKHLIRLELLGGPAILIASLLWTGLARTKIISRRAVRKLFRTAKNK